MTPLHLAVMHETNAILMQLPESEFSCARKLMEFGASLTAVDKQGHTPRDLAGMYGPLMLDLFDEVMSSND